MADLSQSVFGYGAESTWGTTDSIARQNLLITSESMEQGSEIIRSNSILSDRQVDSLIRAGIDVTGDVNGELRYTAWDDWLEAALGGTWATDTPSSGTDRLDNGTTARSFTLEKEFSDDTEFMSFTGCRINTLNVQANSRSIATIGFGFIGKGHDAAGATVFTGAATAANTNQIYNTSAHMTAINEGGGAATGIGNIGFTLNNNLFADAVVGDDEAFRIGYGQVNVEGSLTAYFTDRTLYEKYVDFTVSSLDFTLTDDASNALKFEFPTIQYTTGRVLQTGPTGSVLAELSWEASKDDTDEIMIRIER